MKLLFMGDSLIEFFDWQDRFPEHSVANLGVAGESVGGLLSRVVKVGEAFPQVDSVFIMSGINNLAMGDDQFLSFFQVILESLKSFYPDAGVYVHSILPVAVGFISDDIILKCNKDLKKLAKEMGVEFIDMHSRFIDRSGRVITEYLLDDGIHISRTGYDVWARVIEEILGIR